MFEKRQCQIDPATRAAVLRMLTARGMVQGLDAVVEEALQAWLRKAACDDPQAARAAVRGYQWKSLFLPEGTCVRFSYKRETHVAQVRGNELIYQNQAFSPRQLLLFVTGTVRNAWREMWIRSPGDFRWHLADTRRHILRRTPQGRHRLGIDLARPAPPAPPDGLARPAVATVAGLNAPSRFTGSLSRAAAQRAILYRDDLVRPDQPDLTCRLGGGGPCRAGRAGPRDRRWNSHLSGTGQPPAGLKESRQEFGRGRTDLDVSLLNRGFYWQDIGGHPSRSD